MSSRKKRGKKKKKKVAKKKATPSSSTSNNNNNNNNKSTTTIPNNIGGFNVQEIYQNMQTQLFKCGKSEPDSIDVLRLKYQLMGKKKWWFIMEECLAEIGKKLLKDDYVFVDGFIDEEDVKSLKEDVKNIYESGELRLGVLAGGKAGKSLTYTHKKVRGDVVEWYDGSEKFWKKNGSLNDHLQKCDTFVSELGNHINGLDGVLNRSKAMVTCYPGNGARYIKHTDNNCKFGDGNSCNGRRLTALTYLNDEWKTGDGGELRVYGRDGEKIKAEVAPVAGRILLFWSDFRVPHEVLPTYKERFAITLWYFDKVERARAISSGITDTEEGKRTGNVGNNNNNSTSSTGGTNNNDDAEYERIRKEVEKMEQEYGPGATLNVNISKEEELEMAGGGDDDGKKEKVKQEEEEAMPKITMIKKSNTDGGISFVRIGIEENTIDSDDEVEDEKEVNKVVKNDEVAVTEIVVDNAPKITSDTIRDDAYKMYEAESDVWELDD